MLIKLESGFIVNTQHIVQIAQNNKGDWVMQLDIQPQPVGVFDTKAPIMKLTDNDIHHMQEEDVIK